MYVTVTHAQSPVGWWGAPQHSCSGRTDVLVSSVVTCTLPRGWRGVGQDTLLGSRQLSLCNHYMFGADVSSFLRDACPLLSAHQRLAVTLLCFLVGGWGLVGGRFQGNVGGAGSPGPSIRFPLRLAREAAGQCRPVAQEAACLWSRYRGR